MKTKYSSVAFILLLAILSCTASQSKLMVNTVRKLAEQGNAQAQFDLGHMYQEGDGVTKNITEAVKWVKKAAEQGNSDAQHRLGYYYAAGLGVPQNYAEAMKWYLKAAEQGNAKSYVNIGAFYVKGWGVRKDYAKAIEWLLKAAEKGNSDAQCALGLYYEKGFGVPLNYAEAMKWYLKAADQGDDFAYRQIGNMYAEGRGVAFNQAEAQKWWDKETESKEARKNAEKEKEESKHNEIYSSLSKEIPDLKKKAKNNKSSTLTFKSLYLGMPIEDAYKLLVYYVNTPNASSIFSIIEKGNEKMIDSKYALIKTDSSGLVNYIKLDGYLVRIVFDLNEELPLKDFIKTFIEAYNIPEMTPLIFDVKTTMSGQDVATLGKQTKYYYRSDNGYLLNIYGEHNVKNSDIQEVEIGNKMNLGVEFNYNSPMTIEVIKIDKKSELKNNFD